MGRKGLPRRNERRIGIMGVETGGRDGRNRDGGMWEDCVAFTYPERECRRSSLAHLREMQ